MRRLSDLTIGIPLPEMLGGSEQMERNVQFSEEMKTALKDIDESELAISE